MSEPSDHKAVDYALHSARVLHNARSAYVRKTVNFDSVHHSLHARCVLSHSLKHYQNIDLSAGVM
eukprot:3381489-Pleurochrysis_carterae.AAC.1